MSSEFLTKIPSPSLKIALPKSWSRMLILVISLFVFGPAVQTLAYSPFGNTYARVPSRLNPTINAISLYEKKHGKPPTELKELVPEFLSKLPEPMGDWAYVHE